MPKLQTKKAKLEPAIIVIFGLTGDLARRKLLPALYYLVKNDLLDKDTRIVGISRGEVSVKEVVKGLSKSLRAQGDSCQNSVRRKLEKMISMRQMNLEDAAHYKDLGTALDKIEDQHNVHMNRLFYLSIPPQMFEPVINKMGMHGLNGSCQHGAAVTRLLVEKPFGYDQNSAKELIEQMSQHFGEDQIFRIDHYMAKETVQNILTFRLNNPVFNSIWNAKNISHIQLTANEKIDIEGRAVFYEQTGALRDIIQSHLLQLLAILTMEPPEHRTAEAMHAAKLQLLDSIHPVSPDKIWQNSARGQYKNYKKEVNNPKSRIETYAALRLEIDNDRWRGVPVLLRSGKALAEKVTELCLVFKPLQGENDSNVLTFKIQPEEGITLHLQAKKPGFEYETESVKMRFSYEQTFRDHGHPDAYERVLVDAVRGDHMLFATSETVMSAWRIVEPVIQAWSATDERLESYQPKTWGPASAAKLAENSGLPWIR
ncbi:MAG: glucose-6-phosphate dehydrogenase [Candidatus Saccharimonadales bacterium]